MKDNLVLVGAGDIEKLIAIGLAKTKHEPLITYMNMPAGIKAFIEMQKYSQKYIAEALSIPNWRNDLLKDMKSIKYRLPRKLKKKLKQQANGMECTKKG